MSPQPREAAERTVVLFDGLREGRRLGRQARDRTLTELGGVAILARDNRPHSINEFALWCDAAASSQINGRG